MAGHVHDCIGQIACRAHRDAGKPKPPARRAMTKNLDGSTGGRSCDEQAPGPGSISFAGTFFRSSRRDATGARRHRRFAARAPARRRLARRRRTYPLRQSAAAPRAEARRRRADHHRRHRLVVDRRAPAPVRRRRIIRAACGRAAGLVSRATRSPCINRGVSGEEVADMLKRFDERGRRGQARSRTLAARHQFRDPRPHEHRRTAP